MPDHKLDLSRAPRIADMINAWFCPQCGLRDETARGIDQDGTCSSCGSYCCTWDSVRGHLAHYGWKVVSADDVGATTALQRRVEELTAELGKAKARSQHNYECANTQAKRANDAEEKLCSANRRWQELYDETCRALATERAAHAETAAAAQRLQAEYCAERAARKER